MDQCFERHIPQHTQEIANLNKPIVIKESIINNLLKQKAPGLHGFTGEFYEAFKAEIMPNLYNSDRKSVV